MAQKEASVTWPGVEDYIHFALELKKRCSLLSDVHGVGKLDRKIGAELKFLNTLKNEMVKVQSCHLQSSNLCHFASVVHAMERVPGLIGVLQPFNSPSRSTGLVVDVLAGHGHLWVKVIARKAQALHLIWAGQGQFGERDLLNQAKEYLSCAQANLHHFTPPLVYFAFYNQVTRPMAEALACLGIQVLGNVVEVKENILEKLTSLCLDDEDDDPDNENEYGDISAPVIKIGLPKVASRHSDSIESVSSHAIENKEVSTCKGSVEACASFEEHSANRPSPSDMPIRSDQGILASKLSAEDIHFTKACSLDIMEKEHFTRPTVEKHSHSHSSTLYYEEENSNRKLPQPLEPISGTNQIDQRMCFSLETSPGHSSSGHQKVITSKAAFTHPCNLTGHPQSSNSRADGHFDVMAKRFFSNTNPIHETKLDGDKSFANENSESLPKEEMEIIHSPIQRQSHERLYSSTEYNASTSAHTTPLSSDPSPSSPFDALFEHIVLSPPVFRSDGSALLECISSEFRHREALSPRDHTISMAPLFAPLPLRKANLDISTLITLVSSVSHGNSHFLFTNKVLSLQAEEERKNPVLPALKQFLEGKQLLACHTAVSSFGAILDTLGGPQEKARSAELMNAVHVVPDEPSTRTMALESQGKIKERSKIVFGTGDHLRAVTVTSNMGFVRAAKNQGVVFSVFFHQARALTEQKESDAQPLLGTS